MRRVWPLRAVMRAAWPKAEDGEEEGIADFGWKVNCIRCKMKVEVKVRWMFCELGRGAMALNAWHELPSFRVSFVDCMIYYDKDLNGRN